MVMDHLKLQQAQNEWLTFISFEFPVTLILPSRFYSLVFVLLSGKYLRKTANNTYSLLAEEAAFLS